MKNIVNLGNVATYINGYAFKPSDWAEDGTPIIRIQDLTGNSYQMNRFKGIVDSKYDVNSGDVLISWSASLGVYVWNRGNAVLNQHIFKVVFDKEEVDKDFFVFQIDNLLKRAANQAHGATMRHLTKPVFDALPFYLPDIKTQRLISSKLNLIVHLIEDHHEQLKKLDELIRSRFIEMFGHSDRPKVRLGECCIINPKKSSDIRLVDNDLMVSFVSMSDVSEDGQIVTCNHKQYESVKSGFTYFSENDVLFAKITPCMENGKGGIAKGLLNGIGFGSTEFHVLRPIDQVSNSCWLYELTSFPQFRQAAEINMTGSAGQRRVPASFLANYKVSLPPISLQNQFADFVHQLDKSKMAIQKSLDELETLKKSLMQTYFG